MLLRNSINRIIYTCFLPVCYNLSEIYYIICGSPQTHSQITDFLVKHNLLLTRFWDRSLH